MGIYDALFQVARKLYGSSLEISTSVCLYTLSLPLRLGSICFSQKQTIVQATFHPKAKPKLALRNYNFASPAFWLASFYFCRTLSLLFHLLPLPLPLLWPLFWASPPKGVSNAHFASSQSFANFCLWRK